MSLQARGGTAAALPGRTRRKQPVPPAVDFDRLAKLFSDEHTSGLIERQASELRRAAASVVATGGLTVSSLPAVCSILSSVQDRVPQHSDLLTESAVQLVQYIARPFVSRKANEGANNPDAVHAALLQIASLMLCDEPVIAMAAGNTLTHFAQATHTEGRANGSSWAQNQAMLRSANVLPTIVDAFHAEVGALLALDVDGDGYIDETEYRLQRNIESGASARSPSSRQAGDSAGGTSLDVAVPVAANGSSIEHKSSEDASGRARARAQQHAMFEDASSSDDEISPFGATGGDHYGNAGGSGEADAGTLAETGTSGAGPGFKSTVFLETLTHLVQCLSMHSANARALIRAGAADALVTLLDVVQSPRQPIVAHVVETLWNLCEHSAAALYEGGVALSLKGLLRKHRTENACYLLSTVQVFEVFGSLFRRLLAAPATAFVRSLRNDVLVVATLVARSPSLPPLPPPTGLGAHAAGASSDTLQHSSQGAAILGGGGLVLESGLLHEVLLYSTACEMGLPTEAPFRAFGTAQEGDMQLKTLLWDLVLVSVMSEQEAAEGAAQAKHELQRRQQLLALKKGGSSVEMEGGSDQTREGAFAHSLPVLQEVKSSLFIHALLCYLDPAQDQHPYLRAWTPAQRRALELQALSVLLALAPRCLAEFGEAGGPTVTLLYLRKHAGMLSVKQVEGGGKVHMEGGAGGVDSDLSTPFVPADVQDLVDGEDDGDRVYLALRLLTVTSGAGAEGGSKWSEGGSTHGSDFAAAVGELGGVQDIIALLRSIAPAADALVSASAATGLGGDLPPGTPLGLGLGVFKGGKLAAPAGMNVSSQMLAQTASVMSGSTPMDGTNRMQGGSTPSLGVVASIGGCSTPPAHIVEAALTAVACLCRAQATQEAHLGAPSSQSEGGPDDDEEAAVAAAVAFATAAAEDAAAVASLNKDRLRQCGGVGVLLTWLQACIRNGGQGGLKSLGEQPVRAPGAPPLDPSAATITLSRGGTRGLSVVDAVTQTAGGHADELARSTAIKASVTAAVAATQGVGTSDNSAGGSSTGPGRSSGEQGHGAGRAQVAAAVVAALWCGVQGSADGVAQMLAVGGVEALLDLVEVCSVAEAAQVLGVLADVLKHPSAGAYLRAWRSQITGVSAVGLILRTWAEEESRLGVHRGAFGELPETVLTVGGSAANVPGGPPAKGVQGGSDQLDAPLGGSSSMVHEAIPGEQGEANSEQRTHLQELLRWVQVPVGHRRPLDSKILSDGIVPPGSTPGAVLGSAGGFNPNTMLGSRKAPRGGGARNAFGRLTEALRAGKMWDMASGGGPKVSRTGRGLGKKQHNLGVDSAAASTLDLRGKLFGVLSGAGLDDLRSGSAGDFKCVGGDASAGCTFEVASRYGELVRGQAWDRVASALQGQAESVASVLGQPGAAVGSVPPHSVSLQPCVRGVPLAPSVPTTSDARELMGKLDEHANVLQNTRARQRSLAAEAHATQASAEEATLASVQAQRYADEKNATLAVRTRLRRARCPGDMYGLGIAERKAARSGMDGMLARSRRAGEVVSMHSGQPLDDADAAAPGRAASRVNSSALASAERSQHGSETADDDDGGAHLGGKYDSDGDTSDEEADGLWLGGAPVDPTM